MIIYFVQPRVPYYQGGGEKYPLDALDNLSLEYPDNSYVLITAKLPKEKQSLLYKSWVNMVLSRSNISIIELPISDEYSFLYDIEPGQDRYRWDIESIHFGNIAYRYIENLRNNEKPDVVWSFYIADFPFKLSDGKSVLNLIGYPRNASDYRDALLMQYDAIVSINDNVISKWNDLLDIKIRRYKTLPLGIDFKKKNINKVIKSRATKVIYFGRLIERKGIFELCDAIKILLENGEKVELSILGEGPARKKIEEFISINKLQKSIKLIGYVNNTVDYLVDSDICILPSSSGDGQMSTVLEGMWYCGVVVTTRNNGNEDYIIDGVNGYLIENNNPVNIVSCYFRHKALNKHAIKTMKRKAAESVINNSWSNYSDKFIKICSDLITEKK